MYAAVSGAPSTSSANNVLSEPAISVVFMRGLDRDVHDVAGLNASTGGFPSSPVRVSAGASGARHDDTRCVTRYETGPPSSVDDRSSGRGTHTNSAVRPEPSATTTA